MLSRQWKLKPSIKEFEKSRYSACKVWRTTSPWPLIRMTSKPIQRTSMLDGNCEGFGYFLFAVAHTMSTTEWQPSNIIKARRLRKQWVYGSWYCWKICERIRGHHDHPFHQRIMQRALSIHALSIVALCAMRSRKSGERLSTNLAWQIFRISRANESTKSRSL